MGKLNSINQPHALTPPQLLCLASDGLRAVVEALALHGPLTRLELAARLEAPATSLHYRLGRLVRAGLVAVEGKRPGRRRPEVLYRLIAPHLTSALAVQTQDGRRALSLAARRLGASAGRAAQGAILAGEELQGPSRGVLVRRLLLELDEEGLADLNGLIDALITRVEALPRRGGKKAALTLILG